MYCRTSYIALVNVLDFEPIIDQHQDLLQWSYDIHELVNEKLHYQSTKAKYVPKIKFEELLERLERNQTHVWKADVVVLYNIFCDHFLPDRKLWLYMFVATFPTLVKESWINLLALPTNDCTFQRNCFCSKENFCKFVKHGTQQLLVRNALQ